MNLIKIPTGTSNTYRELSPDLWSRIPWDSIRNGNARGVFRYEDWSDLPLAPTLTTQIAYGKYKAFATTGSSVSRVSAINSSEVLGGALKLATDTDNDSALIGEAYPANLRMSGVSGTDGLLAFECCIAQKSVATNMAASFIGLAETDLMTFATALPLNAGDPITNDGSFIGFRIEEDGLGVIDTVYSDRATSFTNIGDTEGGTLTAYTFRKLGFLYDPSKTTDCVTFYANNVKLASKLSRTTLTGLTNLDANPLGFFFGTVADSAGTTHEIYCKWAAWAQLYPDSL